MKKDNDYYLMQTIKEIDTIQEYSRDLELEEMNENPAIVDGIIFRMIQMSEHMNNISQDFKLMNYQIDWISIKGFRNRLVHDYGDVDLVFVYNAIKEDIPKLKQELLKLLNKVEY